MSTLTSIPTSASAEPRQSKRTDRKPTRRAKPRRRPAPPARATARSIVDLADAIDQAVELNRNRAVERDVRIACVVLDPLPVLADEYALADALDGMLANAIANTVWGSRIELRTGLVRERVVVRIRFLKPGSDQSPWSVDDGELCGTWPAASIGTGT